MGKHGTRARHPNCAAPAQGAIADSDNEIPKEDAKAQTVIAASRPARRKKRTYERTQPAAAEQNAHAEHRSASSIHPMPMQGEFAFAKDRENYPARADHEFAGLGE